MSTYMDLYSQIKGLEPVFRVPANYETIDVGTFDAASGVFSGLKTSVFTDPEPVQHGPGQHPHVPAPHYQGAEWVSVTIGQNWRMTVTTTPAPKVGLAPVLLKFSVKNQRNSAWSVTVRGQTVRVPASQGSLLINIWDLPVAVWKISCGSKSYSDKIMIQRPANAIVGAGAFTVPALPLSIVYAPPADAAKASRTSYTVSEIVGTTSSFQITSDTSSSHPWLPQNLADLNTLQTGLNGISAGLSNFKDPYSKAIAVACGAIAAGIGKMSGTATSGKVSGSGSAVTVTESKNNAIYAEAKNGGPGAGDSIHYLRDAKFAWLMSGGRLQICLLGGTYASYPARYLKQHSGETQTTGISQDVTNMLLGLDPFVAGGPTAALPPRRYKDISGVLNGPIEYGGGQPLTGSYTQTYSVTETRTSTSYDSHMQDFNPGWLAKIFGAQAQTLKTSVSVTHAAGTTKTDTQTYSWELYSGPNEHFIVEFWLDQVFGTLALRQQELAGKPRLRGIAKGPLGNPLTGKPVTLTQAGKTYHAITDSHGQYAFFSTAIPEGQATVRIGDEPPHAVVIERK
jgi:hypothetical protein